MTRSTDPINVILYINGEVRDHGLTKREYFAGQALIGFLSGDNALTVLHEEAATYSVAVADALIKELSK